jgi:hypothetical protein
MTSNFVKFLMIAHEAGMLSLMEDEHVRSYSGRAMYGSHCPGITCPDTHSTLMKLCEAAECLTSPDMILYFPGIDWDQEEYNKFYQDEVGALEE